MRYFANCQTIPELKKAYRAAARIHHPDRGGDTATMQRINADYEAKTVALQHGKTRAHTTWSTEPTAEDYAREAQELHEYEVRENARRAAYNKHLREQKAEARREMAADPELAELVTMTGNEIAYESKLIHWACVSGKWYYEARNYVINMRGILKAKEYAIWWETWAPTGT